MAIKITTFDKITTVVLVAALATALTGAAIGIPLLFGIPMAIAGFGMWALMTKVIIQNPP